MKKYAILLLTLLALTTCETDDDITLQYELKTSCVPVEGGTIEPGPGMFNEGSKIEVTAVPAENYVFKNWSGCVSGNDNPTSIEMTQNRSVTAVFEKMTYGLTIEVQGDGYVRQSVVVNKSTTDYPVGTSIQLTAVPEGDSEFDRWEGDYEGTENPIVIIMNETKSVTAIFKEVELDKTYVPDDKFEQALIDLGLDDALDDYVNTRDISDVEWLDVSNKNIDDLTGIEDFDSLTHFTADNNNLTSIPPSFGKKTGFIQKGRLDLRNNQLRSLDISQLTFFNALYVSGNPLTCIQMNENQLQAYSVAMYFISADEGVEFSIDCSQTGSKVFVPDDNFEQALIDLGLDFVLDDYVYLASIENIEELNLENREISDLTGIEGFKNLKILVLSNNLLQIIDVSQISFLEQLICDRNQLTSLDVSHNTGLQALVATDNQLNCIQVSSYQLYWINWVGGPGAPWFAIDEGVELSVDCFVTNTQRTFIPDDGLEQALIDLGFDQVLDDYVNTIDILNLSHLDISGRNISDLTGLEDFRALVSLNASNNDLTDVDISEWGTLFGIDLRGNPINCIQMNSDQRMSYEGFGIPEILTDDGVILSLDCGF